MTDKSPAETVHLILGSILVLSVIGLAFVDVIPDYAASRQFALILAGLAAAILGVGGAWAKVFNRL